MKHVYLLALLLGNGLLASAQVTGKAYNEVVDSTAIPQPLVTALRKLAPQAKDVSWGHLFCTKCPKDGTYSYYQAEFYQGDEGNSIVFDEQAQLIASKLKIALADLPNAVQKAIGKRVEKLEQDVKKTQLDITSLSEKGKIFYKTVFYIPTANGKHWTPYDELVFNASGAVTKLKDIE